MNQRIEQELDISERTTKSSSKYLDTEIWSPKPFRRLVFNAKSLASACPEAGSRGRNRMLESVGSPRLISGGSIMLVKVSHTWHDSPMIEHLLTECLTLSCRPQVSLEPICVNDRNQGFDSIERRPGFGDILRDVPSSARQNSIHGRDTISRGLDFHIVYWFHQTWGGLRCYISEAGMETIVRTMRKDE